MSSILRINGAELRIGRATRKDQTMGDMARAFSGRAIKTSRVTKRAWDFTTTLYETTEADAWIGLLRGDGHSWAFSDEVLWSYSSKGLPKETGSATCVETNGKFSGYLAIPSAASVTWDVDLPSLWSIGVWRGASTPPTTWTHYLIRSDGAKWVNGVRNDGASTPFLTVSSGSAILGDSGSGSTQYFSDFVVLPFLVSADMAEAFGTSMVAFSSLPQLLMDSDGGLLPVGAGTLTVVCSDDITAEAVQFQSSTWTTGYKLSFSMEEL